MLVSVRRPIDTAVRELHLQEVSTGLARTAKHLVSGDREPITRIRVPVLGV
jgi:hypothetical protein